MMSFFLRPSNPTFELESLHLNKVSTEPVSRFRCDNSKVGPPADTNVFSSIKIVFGSFGSFKI